MIEKLNGIYTHKQLIDIQNDLLHKFEEIVNDKNGLYDYNSVSNYAVNHWINHNNGDNSPFEEWFDFLNSRFTLSIIEKPNIDELGITGNIDLLIKTINKFKEQNKNGVHTFEELSNICEEYKEVGFDVIFDDWYKIYTRGTKLRKLKSLMKK